MGTTRKREDPDEGDEDKEAERQRARREREVTNLSKAENGPTEPTRIQLESC